MTSGDSVEQGLPVVLTVAGSDSSGGAGIVADAATFRALGVWPAVAITAVTAQHPGRVIRVDVLDPELVRAQIEAVVAGLGVAGVGVGGVGVAAVKTGMLGAPTVRALVSAIADFSLPAPVVDPVLVSSSGRRLLDDAGLDALRAELLPLAGVVTPNLAEAAALTGLEVVDADGMVRAAAALVAMGCRAVLVTGGHLNGDRVADCLVTVDQPEPFWITGPRIRTTADHGTGCVLSAAIAAHLARGARLEDACVVAAQFVREALARGVAGSVNPAVGS